MRSETHVPRVGVNIQTEDPQHLIEKVKQAEAAGVGTVWGTMFAEGLDKLMMYAAAAVQTESIVLGTSVIPAFTRHPLALANQALVLDRLAPGRLRLGIGTSHGPSYATPYGQPFRRPLAQLREYLQVLRPAIREGAVSFLGEHYRVNARLETSANIPVLVSALRERAWELAGELSDGGISWLCPLRYLVDRARPAMVRGAARAGRVAPPLVAHIPVVLDTNRDSSRRIGQRYVQGYADLPFYADMFAQAGYPPGDDGTINIELIDDLFISGDDDAVAAQLQDLLDQGLDELLVVLVPSVELASEELRLLNIIGRM